ncbi:hypothetical protein EK21DRAFT_107943 [Setomelanomma holmii]|uniref:RING-type domain-containing protein n=1 Tax=Setomelanomma holmii TaxID=210430 RepID=A0A9P4HHV4_9PLEO|nr:hypothetical protein EK21DRAFT_107943 [Setomelanomma holmii]
MRYSSNCAILITPKSLNALDDKDCPICKEPYLEPPSTHHNPSPDQEWAVSIDMVADVSGPKDCCGHIMGRRCLDQHLAAPGPWRTKCPLCRDVWFRAPFTMDVDEEDQEGSEVETSPVEDSLVEPLRRSRRIAERNSRPGTPNAAMGEQSGVSSVIRRQSRTRRRARARGFARQLFAALEVEEGSSEVRCTLEEVKQKLEALYGIPRRFYADQW